MKLLKFGISVLFAITLFSSCLGDSDDTLETNSFAYITTSKEGVKYATTPYMYLTSPKIDDLDNHSCALIHFKASNSGSGYNEAEKVEIIKENLYKTLVTTEIPRIDPANEVYPTELSNDWNTTFGAYYGGYYAYSSNFGDNWLFYTKFAFDIDTEVAAYFYYNEYDQKITDDKGTPVGDQPDPNKNQKIIDVRFEKNPLSNGYIAPKNEEVAYFVSSMSSFRNRLDPKETEGSKTKIVPIKFRYKRNVKKAGTSDQWEQVQTIIGSWDNGSTQFRCLAFEK